ncbi:lipid-A-disaccharide kinase [Halopseudomonas litoralis]|uniref:Tetraacyldisaccharide 4'-kinase n=2 Tax=Halopseudomonas litoralis TaxID=797277 RepID=A0A1H1RRF4_9GAMM|nr:lipid-A-disaccharide kinase [Halopseudomonas litoralis]
MKRFSLENFMLRSWYGKRSWLVLLRPLSQLYQRVALNRRQRYLDNPEASWQPPVPLIVVGNITLGGTGKTPMVIWLVEHLRARGLRVGVISRGYGAQPPSLPWRIQPAEDGPEQVGDEPLLIAGRCQVPVIIDPDRARAGRHLLEHAEVDVIISDDGLQHYRMGRTLELVMLDHARGLGNARCLPEGPLREPASRLDSVDLVVRNGAEVDTAGAFAMQLQATELVNLKTGQRIKPAEWKSHPGVQAVAGIGNPQRFCKTLENLALVPTLHAFADHARYNAESFAEFDHGEPLIMTEKDAVKCVSFAREHWWFLRVDAQLSAAFAAALHERLDSHLPSSRNISP